MNFKIENQHLKKATEFLEGLELSGKASRVRVKLNSRLEEKLQEFSLEYAKIKEKFDELKSQEKYEELEELLKDSEELIKEVSIIDMTEYSHLILSLKVALEDYEGVMNGDDAVAHDVILDALEAVLPAVQSTIEVDQDIEEAQFQEVE